MSSLHPPKLIRVNLQSAVALDLWSGGGGDPWTGTPWSWTCQLTVTPQLHSDATTTHPFQYGGADIIAGDWIYTTGQGRALRVRSVSSWVDPIITLILEDVDRINQLSDGQQAGSAGISLGDGLLFTAVGGVPALYPLPDSLVGLIPGSAVGQLISRFASLRRGERVEVVQNAHGFTVGTEIAIQGGTYVAVPSIAGSLTPVGVVVEVDDLSSGPNKFYYRPIGTLVFVAIPGGTLGSPMYRDSNGALTFVPPVGDPTPVATWIDSQRVLLLQQASPVVTSVQQIIASENLSAGDLVNIWSNAGVSNVRRAVGSSINTQADGFVQQSVQAGQLAPVVQGANGLLSGLTPGVTLYLDLTLPGKATATNPLSGTPAANSIYQVVGRAVNATTMQFRYTEPILLP